MKPLARMTSISDGLGPIYAAWRIQPPWLTAHAPPARSPKTDKVVEDEG